MDETLSKLTNIISEKFGVPDNIITMDASLTDDLNLSPLEISDLIGLCAGQFNLHFNEAINTAKIKTVGDVVNLVEEYSQEL